MKLAQRWYQKDMADYEEYNNKKENKKGAK